MDNKFIHVQGVTDRDRMLAAGLQLVAESGDMYTFVDNGNVSKAVFAQVHAVVNNKIIFA